jgi:hypothetical protein
LHQRWSAQSQMNPPWRPGWVRIASQ